MKTKLWRKREEGGAGAVSLGPEPRVTFEGQSIPYATHGHFVAGASPSLDERRIALLLGDDGEVYLAL